MGLVASTVKGLGSLGIIRTFYTSQTGWLECDGSNYSRTTYSFLFGWLTETRTVTTTNGSPVITVNSPLSKSNVGTQIELTGVFTAGTTILSIDGTVVTLSANASSGAGGTMLFAPHGLGTTTTFKTPRMNGRIPRANIPSMSGTKGGVARVQIATANLPSHTHNSYDPTHYHSVSNWGSHHHGLNGAGFPAPYTSPYNTKSGASAGGAYVAYWTISGAFSDTLTISSASASPFPANTTGTGPSSGAEFHENVQPTYGHRYYIKHTQ